MAAQVGISPTTRTRLATLMGFPPEPASPHDRPEDWFIPYNGPVEPPRNEGRTGRARAASNATRKSFASSQGTRSFYNGGGIGEAPVNSTRDRASTFGTRDRASTYSTRDRTSTYSNRDRASTYSPRDRTSTYSRDVDWDQRDKERENRGSITSFLTFGRGARKSAYVFPKAQQPHRSEESRDGVRRNSNASTTSVHHPPILQRGSPSLIAADRSRPATARDSMEVSGAVGVEVSERQPTTYDFTEPITEPKGWYQNDDFSWDPKPRQLQARDALVHSMSNTVSPTSPSIRHPYAVAFPSGVHEPRHLLPVPIPATYSHTPKRSQSTTHSHSTASSKNLLPPQAQTKNLLRGRSATVSTPNLRGRFAADNSSSIEKPKSRKPSLRKVQYAAETWCDALMFPRPRFRAHVVSPPESPEDEKKNELLLQATGTANVRPEQVERRTLDPVSHADSTDPPSLIKSRQHVPAPIPIVSIASFFAPADLSPGEETMHRVLAEGAQRDMEREKWNEVASMSFQNRRSRSLSRTRSRKYSGPSRVRVESDASKRKEVQGLGGLAVGLAMEAFRQPTPTISVSKSRSLSSGSNVHSRNESASASGHGHNITWNKKLTTPDDTTASPEERLEGALLSEKTARVSVRGRREEAAEADVQFVDIAPMPPPTEDRSRTHSRTSDSLDVPTVGIAISTPPPPPSPLPDLSSHPYAQSHFVEPLPISATYAGPHPTSIDYTHHQSYSTIDPRNPRSTIDSELTQHYPVDVPPPVPAVDLPSQKSAGPWERGAYGAYAYADTTDNDKRESALGIEEVLLSRTFQRGTDNTGTFENPAEYEEVPFSDPTPTYSTKRPRRKPVPVHTDTSSGIPSLSHTVSTATQTEIHEGEIRARILTRENSTALSSPTSQASVSTSPRPVDDLEPFRDLFYKPSIPQLSSEARRVQGESVDSWSEHRIRSSEGLNGLRALTRRRSSYESSPGKEQAEWSKQHTSQGPYLDGVQEVQLGRSSSPLPGLNNEPLQLGTPLRAEFEGGQNFPEDIESSRASSIIEHDSTEETLRLGTVQLAVPETTKNERRQSTTLSFDHTEDGGSFRPNRSTVATTTSSLGIPATAEDLVRTSFTTTTSSTSHMSNLIEDFPFPPAAAAIVPPPPSIPHSYLVPSTSDTDTDRVPSDSVSK